MVELIVNKELENICKEVVISKIEIYPDMRFEELQKIVETSVGIAGFYLTTRRHNPKDYISVRTSKIKTPIIKIYD
jgi:uncharacterized secreted protein with C-terminal beta-propeller domain